MRFKKPLKVTSRLSSVTNGFVQAIIPQREPTEEEVEQALSLLGMTVSNPECVYCGAPQTDWDHLKPLVRGRRPTGYLHEIQNIVPACGTCNQSKGGQDWRVWMMGSAKNSPRSRGVQDLERRKRVIERFEAWGGATRIDFEMLVDAQDWGDYWRKLSEIEELMKGAEVLAVSIANSLRAQIGNRSGVTRENEAHAPLSGVGPS